MNVIRRRVLRLVGVGAATIVFHKHALGLDAEAGAEIKLVMGPTSAAPKPGGAGGSGPPPNQIAVTCAESEKHCATQRHRFRQRRKDRAVSTK
jgi:hypothetical protein